MLHEKTSDAAKRRMKFELGLTGVKLHLILPDYRYRAEKDGIVENEICPVFVGFTDKTPHPNPDEIADIRWMDWNEFLTFAADPENGISPWAIEEASQLNASRSFKEVFRSYANNP
jgi:isopentenyl-diphosphate delta-isomerase